MVFVGLVWLAYGLGSVEVVCFVDGFLVRFYFTSRLKFCYFGWIDQVRLEWAIGQFWTKLDLNSFLEMLI